MRWISMMLFLASAVPVVSQTGPGGVGSSASNVLWLDANHGVIQSGGFVSQWNDRSGNSNHALLPGTIPLAHPSHVINSVNGYPSLGFDGTDDQLWVTDHATLDLTQWHFFIVAAADVQKDYNAWMVKGDDSDENFEMLSYSDGNIHTPTKYTDGTRTFPSSTGGQVTTGTFNIFEYSYSSGVGRDVYKNGATIITDNENKTPKVNNLPLYIGNERSTTGRCVNGDIAEVIAFNAPLNAAQRIIVNNYLAAKYDRTLSSNDLYVQDIAGNGNYDHDVAGIGRVNSSNQQTDSRGSGAVRMSKAGYSGLDDGEFMLWGHNNAPLGPFGVTDLPTGVQGRWARVWRVSEVNLSGSPVDVGNVDIIFDLAGLGPVVPGDLRLLVDTDNDGTFADESPINGASSAGGTLYRFSNVAALVNNRRFTLGTANLSTTPLPIELVSFKAAAVGHGRVRLEWVTASELNNDHFTVERSSDAAEWEAVAVVGAAGNSTSPTQYGTEDTDVPRGNSYYRLRQTDTDGGYTFSGIVAVDLSGFTEEPLVYPNPSSGAFHVQFPQAPEQPVLFVLSDAAGRIVSTRTDRPDGTSIFRFEPPVTTSGMYRLRIVSGERTTVCTVGISE